LAISSKKGLSHIMKQFLFTLVMLAAVILMLSATACQQKSSSQHSQEMETLAEIVEHTAGDTVASTVLDVVTEAEEEIELEDDDKYDELRPDYNLGTCRVLKGNVSVILFYMDDFESSWTKDEMKSFTEKEIGPALSFLEKEAKSYGIELNLTIMGSYGGLFYDDEVITSVKLTGLASIDVLEQAAKSLDYVSAEAMIRSHRVQYQTDEVVCLTLFNRNGTSYAINPPRGETLMVEEHCIVFAHDLNSSGNDPVGWQISVVAHELLHLFGAEDFYASATRKALARVIYPGDLMLSAQYDIRANNIGDATAYYIGWTDIVPEILYDEDW